MTKKKKQIPIAEIEPQKNEWTRVEQSVISNFIRFPQNLRELKSGRVFEMFGDSILKKMGMSMISGCFEVEKEDNHDFRKLFDVLSLQNENTTFCYKLQVDLIVQLMTIAFSRKRNRHYMFDGACIASKYAEMVSNEFFEYQIKLSDSSDTIKHILSLISDSVKVGIATDIDHISACARSIPMLSSYRAFVHIQHTERINSILNRMAEDFFSTEADDEVVQALNDICGR